MPLYFPDLFVYGGCDVDEEKLVSGESSVRG
jgi:hypothetical protein